MKKHTLIGSIIPLLFIILAASFVPISASFSDTYSSFYEQYVVITSIPVWKTCFAMETVRKSANNAATKDLMIVMNEQQEWEKLSAEEKRIQLYFKQKEVLDDFVARGAITQEQYEKSLGDMTEKMGMTQYMTRGKSHDD